MSAIKVSPIHLIMRSLYYTLVFLLVRLTLCFSSGLPTIEVNILNQTLPSSPAGFSSTWLCESTTIAVFQTIPIKRCAKAQRGLPSTHSMGQFHFHGLNDIWRLPRTISYEDCTIKVQFRNPATTATASWVGIKGAISELLLACEARRYERHYFSATRPGRSSTGQDDAIIFSIYRTPGYPALVNETDVVDECFGHDEPSLCKFDSL